MTSAADFAEADTARLEAMTGAEVVTRAVWFEVAWAVPIALVAVTRIRIVRPTSALVSWYVEVVAPAMLVQLPPDELQRRHW